MKIFLRTVKIIGYFFFGYSWFQSCYDVITRNVFFEIFPFEETVVSKTEFRTNAKDSSIFHIQYELNINSKIHKGSTRISKLVFEEKYKRESGNITVCYNKLLPNVNYIKGWEIIDYYKLSFFAFTFFFLFILFGGRVIKRYYQHPYFVQKQNP